MKQPLSFGETLPEARLDKYLGRMIMDTALLRHLGVNEAIINALQKAMEMISKSEILQDRADLRLLVRRSSVPNFKPHVLTIHDFFSKKTFAQIARSDVEYRVERFNCQDQIEFLASSLTARENVRINGIGLRLSDAMLKLFRYLAEKVEATKVGWVYIQDMKADGVIPSDSYQSFSRLRSAVGGYLLKKNPKDFIEANGRKQYRLSVDPKKIKLPKEDAT